jgi:60 kDa SS-A/Ro ribonucleoprotein
MARKTTKMTSTPTDAYKGATEKNYEGFPTFIHDLEDQCLQVMMTGVFENTFYATAEKLQDEALALFQEMAKKDSELFAKMIVFARNQGLLRIVPITALVVLSKNDPATFARAFGAVIRTPNDLKDFVTLSRRGGIRAGLGRGVKRAVNGWLGNISEYHAIKYGSKGSDVSLRDILRITHPKPAALKQDALFNYLVNGLTEGNIEAVRANLPQIWAFEELKDASTTEAQRSCIKAGRLPYEVVVGAVKPDVAMWMELMKQMPIFALLRHLNTLHKNGVFADEANVQYVVDKFTNPELIAKSKILPFRFFTAHKMLTPDVSRRIHTALEAALELSFQNMPLLPGRVCVGSDVSGSMSYSTISAKSNTRPIDICGIFSAACLKKSTDATVLPFETRVRTDVKFSANDTLMTTANQLSRIGGGGTNVGAPIEYLLSKNISVDIFIGITDSEDWAGRGFVNYWREYRKKVNPNAKAFLVTVMPYRHMVAQKSEPGVYFIYGWSDNVLPYIQSTAEGSQTQMAAVREVALATNEGALVLTEDSSDE